MKMNMKLSILNISIGFMFHISIKNMLKAMKLEREKKRSKFLVNKSILSHLYTIV